MALRAPAMKGLLGDELRKVTGHISQDPVELEMCARVLSEKERKWLADFNSSTNDLL